jgi:hypothetical protein
MNQLMADIYKQGTLKLRLNDNALACTKLGKTQRMIGLLYAVLKVMSYNR